MTLISLQFFVFVLIIMAIYYVMPEKFQWVVLLAASLYFYYSFTTPVQFSGFIVLVLLNYIASLFLGPDNKNRKRTYIFILVFNILFLASFKYSRFFYEIFLSIGNLFNQDFHNKACDIFVFYTENYAPLRLSYFGLIIIGYITDVYWEKSLPQKNLGKLMLFTGFFPQMTSGPIVTYEQMEPQLWGKRHSFKYNNIVFGLERILWGVFKKSVVSERCGVIVNSIYGAYEAYSGFYVLVAAILFAFQLYCDFSGLMDIVLGVAQCFDIALPENFDTPFYSLNLSEFWRRWHITLGAFLRDYVLYPIQRSGIFKTLRKNFKKKFGKGYEKKFNLPLYLSLLISWFLIGLWHGGGWNYIFGVGLYMWLVIVIGEVAHPLFIKIAKILHINMECDSYKLFLRVRTFMFFMFGLSFFRAESLKSGFEMWKFAFSTFNPWIFFNESFFNMGLDRREWGILVFGLILLFIVSFIHQKEDVREYLAKQNYLFRIFIFSALFVMIMMWGYYGYSFNAADFIYGRF